MIKRIPRTLWASIEPVEDIGEIISVTLPRAQLTEPTKTLLREEGEVRRSKAFVRFAVSRQGEVVVGEARIFLSKEGLVEIARSLRGGQDPLWDARAVRGRLGELVEELGPRAGSDEEYLVTYGGWEEIPRFLSSEPVEVPRFIFEWVYPSEAVKKAVGRRVSILRQFRFTGSDLHTLLTWCFRDPYRDDWSTLEDLGYAFEGWGRHARESKISWRYLGKICDGELAGLDPSDLIRIAIACRRRRLEDDHAGR